MSDLLFLCQRIPYPPNKGDKLRAFHVLKHLAQRYRVRLGCFIDDPDDWRHLDSLKPYCAEIKAARLTPTVAKALALRGLLTGEALSLPYFRSGLLADWVDGLLKAGSVQAIYGFSSTMAQYVLDRDLTGIPFVQDIVDVDSDKWRQYAARKSGIARWVYQREYNTLLSFERKVAAKADASLFVSEAEADLFRKLVPEHAGKVHAVSNGIDLDFFDPDAAMENPYTGETGPVIAFTGAMNYWPNEDAVAWFVAEIFPAIRRAHPTAAFYIVGANPTPPVSALADQNGVHVTGRVEDIRGYIRFADLCVAPMKVARGIQNKVLEGLAMARPLVTTPQGHEGIDAEPGRDLLVAADAAPFAEDCLAALAPETAATLGTAGRKLVLDRYAWAPNLEKIDALLGG